MQFSLVEAHDIYKGMHSVCECPRAAPNQADNVYETYIFWSRNFADMKHKKMSAMLKTQAIELDLLFRNSYYAYLTHHSHPDIAH